MAGKRSNHAFCALGRKEIFDNSETGRFYEMRAEEGCVVIEFVKREDGSLGRRFFLAIAGLGGSTVKRNGYKNSTRGTVRVMTPF